MRWLVYCLCAAASAAQSARLGGRTVRLFAPSSLIPIPTEQKPSRYTLEILDSEGAVLGSKPITVRDAHYPAQNIVLAKEITDLKPSPGEQDTTKAFRETVSDTRYSSEPLNAPVQHGKPTGSSHGGVDPRGAAGLPVHAAAAGVVRIARHYNLNGGTVGIDRGQESQPCPSRKPRK
jgi:murein DD-endopeptidase MepM/ murein hydrolase activator NlpD